MDIDRLSGEVIGAAIEVHRVVGPGLLESAYEECLAREMMDRRIGFRRQHPLRLHYKGRPTACVYRLDFLVADQLVVELKVASTFAPIHTAQAITYLRLTGCELALLINFNVPVLKDGVKRVILSRK